MSTGYVIAAYFGTRRADDPRMVADRAFYLRKHLAALTIRGLENTEVIVVLSGDVPSCVDDFLSKDPYGIHPVVLRRPNGGMSYGAWAHAFKTLGPDRHDHWIVSEDDYAPARPGFDSELVRLMEEKGPKCGFLCGSVGSLAHGAQPHARVFLGVMRGKAIADVLPSLPIPEGDRYTDAEVSGQIGWSKAFLDAGWTLDEWAPYGTAFWDYTGLRWIGPRRASLFVPIQCVGRPVQLAGGGGLARCTIDGACVPGEATLSVVIPTKGAGTLRRTLESIRKQRLILGDQIIIVQDGASQEAQGAFEQYKAALPLETHVYEDHNWGNPQRNWAIENAAKGEYLVWMDDDDAFADGAFDAIRSAIAVAPGRPLMFRFKTSGGEVLWKSKQLQKGRIGGHEFVTPNLEGLLGRWSREYEGDWGFVQSTLAKWPKDSLVWREEVIAVCRPAGTIPTLSDAQPLTVEVMLAADERIYASTLPDCQRLPDAGLVGRPTIGIVVYTRARPTFGRALESIASQQTIEGDQVIVVAHGRQGPCESAYNQIRQRGLPSGRYEECFAQDLEWTIGDHGLAQLTTDLVLVLDEQDVLAKGALTRIRDAAQKNPGTTLLFQKKARNGVLDRIAVAPRQTAGGYKDFTSSTIGRSPEAVTIDTVIYDIKPYPVRRG